MLTPNDIPQDDMFLTGSAMAAVIANHDWSTTTLGTLDRWPSTLRSVLTTLLASPFPIVLAWGPELITFHNDAYCELLGGRRDAIGLPFLDVWPELREDLSPLFERALCGQTCHFPEAAFMIERNRRQEEAIFNFGLSPVRDFGGAVVGVFNIGVEITARVVAQRQQAAERERLARMFEQAPGFMAILEGPEHRIVLANAAYLKLVGHRAVLGKTVAEALPDAVSQGLSVVLDRVCASGEAHRSSGAKFEARDVPGGPVEERYVDVVFQPLTNEAGDVAGVFLEGADVTDRVHAAAELRASERRNGEILESVSDAFYAVDANWSFTYVNRKAEQLWGRPREQLLGRTIWSVFPQAVNSETYEAHQRAATTRELVRIEAMSPVLDRWVDVSIFPTDGGGLSVYFRDVTERREAQARFRTLLETAPALIFATDQKGQNTFVNQRYQDYTGWSFDDLVGDGWQAVVHPEDRAAAIRESIEGRSESRPLERRLRLRRQDGEWRWFLSRVEPVLEAGAEAEFAWLGISIEIEDQVRAEERERLLSQEVDHRAKNLLAVVQSVVQLTRADDVQALKGAIDGRIQALARSHGLLSAA